MRTLILFTVFALLSVNFDIIRGTPLQRCDHEGNTQRGTSAGQTPTAPTSAAPAQTPESITTAPSPTKKASCIDEYIWIGDGSFYCNELYTPSTAGFNTDPQRWCDYVMTYCCATCSRLRANYGTAEDNKGFFC